MSLLNRKPISIGRGDRKLRDDRVFVVATDDTYAPQQYFENLSLSRVKIVVLPTPLNSGHSAPVHVVQRLKDVFKDVCQRKQVQSGDEFWVLLDTDHYFRPNNKAGTLAALQTAQQVGFEIAISNPCFELWLLLHHEDVSVEMQFGSCDEVGGKIRAVVGAYNKTNIKSGQFTLEQIPNAIERARKLDVNPGEPWPKTVRTHVYKLMERVLPGQ